MRRRKALGHWLRTAAGSRRRHCPTDSAELAQILHDSGGRLLNQSTRKVGVSPNQCNTTEHLTVRHEHGAARDPMALASSVHSAVGALHRCGAVMFRLDTVLNQPEQTLGRLRTDVLDLLGLPRDYSSTDAAPTGDSWANTEPAGFIFEARRESRDRYELALPFDSGIATLLRNSSLLSLTATGGHQFSKPTVPHSTDCCACCWRSCARIPSASRDDLCGRRNARCR